MPTQKRLKVRRNGKSRKQHLHLGGEDYNDELLNNTRRKYFDTLESVRNYDEHIKKSKKELEQQFNELFVKTERLFVYADKRFEEEEQKWEEEKKKKKEQRKGKWFFQK